MSVFANGRLILHAGDGQTHVCAPPDVCKTPSPGGPIPIPYINVAKDSDLAKGAKKTKIEGNPVAIANSEVSTSTGDEPGTAGGGVVSSKTKGTMTWASTSPDVHVEGKGVARFLDPVLHNGNSSNSGFIAMGKADMVSGSDSPCALCGKSLDSHAIPETKVTEGKAKGMLEALGDQLNSQRKEIQRAMELQDEISALNSHYYLNDGLKADELKRIGRDIQSVGAYIAATGSEEDKRRLGKKLAELGRSKTKINKHRTELKRTWQSDRRSVEAEQDQINKGLKGKAVLVLDAGSGTYSKGYMVAIVVCQCGREYVAHSGKTSTPGFKKAAKDASAIVCPLHDSGSATNGGGPMSDADQTKYDDLADRVVTDNHKWQCAAPKCLQKCQDDGHKPTALTEMWFDPFGSRPTKVKRYELKTNGSYEKVVKEVGSGEKAPSCHRCQVLLPGLLCDTKDSLCP